MMAYKKLAMRFAEKLYEDGETFSEIAIRLNKACLFGLTPWTDKTAKGLLSHPQFIADEGQVRCFGPVIPTPNTPEKPEATFHG